MFIAQASFSSGFRTHLLLNISGVGTETQQVSAPSPVLESRIQPSEGVIGRILNNQKQEELCFLH